VKGLKTGLKYRRNESDIEAFLQVFVREEYGYVGGVNPHGLIIDCGANVGYSSAWFMRQYPECQVIAVEPDVGNFEMLQNNLAPFGASVTTVRAAVWSRKSGLVFDHAGYRDRLSWSLQVREARSGEQADVEGYDIPSLIRLRPAARIGLLKMDVERSELDIFSRNTQWLSLCDNIVIELHDSDCERVFFAAIKNQGFDIRRAGELTICSR